MDDYANFKQGRGGGKLKVGKVIQMYVGIVYIQFDSHINFILKFQQKKASEGIALLSFLRFSSWIHKFSPDWRLHLEYIHYTHTHTKGMDIVKKNFRQEAQFATFFLLFEAKKNSSRVWESWKHLDGIWIKTIKIFSSLRRGRRQQQKNENFFFMNRKKNENFVGWRKNSHK